MSLSLGQAEFRQYVKYLTALDFHLACEIVDSYLTHPPLFGICYPKPLVAHSYLVALAASASIIARIAKRRGALTRLSSSSAHHPSALGTLSQPTPRLSPLFLVPLSQLFVRSRRLFKLVLRASAARSLVASSSTSCAFSLSASAVSRAASASQSPSRPSEMFSVSAAADFAALPSEGSSPVSSSCGFRNVGLLRPLQSGRSSAEPQR